MKNAITLLFVILISTAYSQTKEQPKASADFSNFKSEGSYTYKIIDAPEHTFGYEIYTKGKILVQQKNIPSMPGNKGFSTKEKAEKCAKFIITKLNKNIMPPSVTPEELDSLKLK